MPRFEYVVHYLRQTCIQPGFTDLDSAITNAKRYAPAFVVMRTHWPLKVTEQVIYDTRDDA